MHTEALNPQADPRPAAAAMDLADLVSVLVSLRAPSRQVDNVVEAMLGGPSVLSVISPAAVISSRWLSAETPAYTAGGNALSVLARRRGYRIHLSRDGERHVAEVRNLATGMQATASAITEGGAGVAAVCCLASKETARG